MAGARIDWAQVNNEHLIGEQTDAAITMYRWTENDIRNSSLVLSSKALKGAKKAMARLQRNIIYCRRHGFARPGQDSFMYQRACGAAVYEY